MFVASWTLLLLCSSANCSLQKSLTVFWTARQQHFIIEPDPSSASFDASFRFVFHHHGWGFSCCWRINIYQLLRQYAISISSCWREALVLPSEVWKVSRRSQMGVYTSRMIRCFLRHCYRSCALCLSLALFMLDAFSSQLPTSSPFALLCYCAYTLIQLQIFRVVVCLMVTM